jgi:hypothetical protein
MGASATFGAAISGLVDGLGGGGDITTYTVTGRVTSPDSASIGGLIVQLVDKAAGPDLPLGVMTTDATGHYKISVSISSATLQSRLKGQPDFQVRVSVGQTFLAASKVRYNASTSETLDVVLPPNIAALASEYETLAGAIAVNYSGRPGDLQENDERQDIAYLAHKTGWDARAVAFAALADQFSQITAPALAGAPVSLKPEFYYALFRAGFPANADGLFQASPKAVQAVWQQALKQGVIPQALSGAIDGAVQAFATLSASHTIGARPPIGVSSMQEMLQASLPNMTAQQQQQFALLYALHRDDMTAFWSAVETSFGAATTKTLQLHGQLYYLTLNNAPLVSALVTAEDQNPLASMLDLATRGYYSADKWRNLIGSSIPLPAAIPGKTPDEQRNNHAQLLATQVRLSFPTAVAADLVTQGKFKLTDSTAQRAVTKFLADNQGKFEIGIEPVKAYLARTKLTGTPDTVVKEITRLQRVYQLTPDDSTMAVLLQHNLDSAYAIARYDKAGFVRAFKAKLGGSDVAAQIHARAKQIHGAVLNIAVSYLGARIAPTIGGASPVMQYAAPASDPNSSVIAYPTLEGLFGSLDTCSCEDCRSILSPAAYLVDLLHYLDHPSPSPGCRNPQEVLFERRPDLQYLPLTCENTNTALPYIDVVNETLEYFVANGCQSLAGYQGHDTGSLVTSGELMASPQYVNDAAYATLQNAYFPPPLPFNRPLESLRQHMQKIGVALPEVMAALRASDAMDRASPVDYGWRDILMEQLGISRDECRLFTDPTLQLGDLYGFPQNASETVADWNARVLALLQNSKLQDFSRRTGVSYDDLFSIIKTQFINPNAVLIPKLERLNVPFATLQLLKNNKLSPAQFEALLPAGLDAREFGGATASALDAVTSWVVDPKNYSRIMDIITITNPDPNSTDQCSGGALQFLYSNPDSTADLLTTTDFVKLIRFIRLWLKLGLSIEQTDDMLAALFPDDATNLEQGFTTFLLRAGFLFQIMSRLSLSADASLPQLLACWAPIGLVGDNALYKRMFLTPTVLQESEARTATVSGPVSVGDVLSTTINGVQVPYEVQANDLKSTDNDTFAAIAGNIAALINLTVTSDPITNLPLNSRIYADASAQAGVVVIQAGFTLACSPPGKYTATTQKPTSQTTTIAATVAAGDVLTTTIDNIAIPYTVVDGDTPTTIANKITSAINSTTTADPFSGLPLNTLVLATPSAGGITITTINSGAPFDLECSFSTNAAVGYGPGPYSPPKWTATIGGASVNQGDTLVTTINNVDLPYTATATDTDTSTLARSIAANINASTVTDPVSLLPMNGVVSASAQGTIITLTPTDPTTPLTVACAGAESYTANGPLPASQSVFISAGFGANRELITTINGTDIPYRTTATDTPPTIAHGLAHAINNTSPLNNVVAAAYGGIKFWGGRLSAQMVVTAIDPTTTFTMTASLRTGSYTAGTLPSPFVDDGYGNFLQDSTQKIFGRESAICAACNVTGAEFALIAEKLGFDTNSPPTPDKVSAIPLTLPNVSAIFRYGWSAHTLGMSVQEFLRLGKFSGLVSLQAFGAYPLYPFGFLDPGAAPTVEPVAILFIRLAQAIAAAGLTTSQALYLMWNQDISGKSAPPIESITGLARTLRADFAAVEAQFALVDDPDGATAKKLMALVYGDDATNFFFGLLNNALSVSVGYSNPPNQPTLPQPVTDASKNRLSYDDLRKKLSYAGVLDSATQSAIDQAITNNGNYAPLHAALVALAGANRQAVGPFFSAYPELKPLYDAYVASSDPPAAKRTALLANFLPGLKRKRKQEQALASATAAAGADPSFANTLLQDATVLHAAADPWSAAIQDLTAIEAPGLSAQFFLSNEPTATADITVDADGTLSYAPCVVGAAATTVVGGKATAGDVLTTTINGVAIPYAVQASDSLPEDIAANVASAINGRTTADPYSGLPLNNVVSAAASGASVAIKAINSGGGLTLDCSAQLQKAATYSAGPKVLASQIVTIGGATTANDGVTVTISTKSGVNGVAIPYTVVAGDTTPTTLANHIAAAINATTKVDLGSGQPLNQVVSASSAGNVVTITATAFGTSFTVACSASSRATETYTVGQPTPATQTATISGVLAQGGALITTINGVAIPYTVGQADTSEASIAASIARTINETATVNGLVSASNSGSVITISAKGDGAAFTLACSLSSYSAGNPFPAAQTAIVSGGITSGDVLTTTINGVPIAHPVGSGNITIAQFASEIAAAINGSTAADPTTGALIKDLVTVSSVGGVVTIASTRPGIGFSLSCWASPGASSTSLNATETYVAGPQFFGYAATVTGGFSVGDVLTTTINGVAIPYPVTGADTTEAILAHNIAANINKAATLDPATGLPLNGLVIASNAGGMVILKPAGAAFTLSCSLSPNATETYSALGALPAPADGGPIAGIWSGYLNAPQDGFYDIVIATDPGASVKLAIGSAQVALAPTQNNSVWSNQSPISLTAGALTQVELTVQSISNTISVSWSSFGLGTQIIPGESLYSATLVENLQATYVRFLKATSLASSLSLTANELAWLGAATSSRVNTTDSRDTLPPGANTFTPASMANIKKGSQLVIDVGDAQEIVTVTATTPTTFPTTFTATTVKPHDGTTLAFPIVSVALPNIGEGWLNFLAVSGDPDAGIAARLRDVLTSVLNYARIKQALSPSDERLLAVLQAPSSTLSNGVNALLSLTQWDPGSLLALLNRFFRTADFAGLSSVENFRRVYDAYAFAQTCRISAATLIAVTTNAPSAKAVAALQSALRALYAESDWLTVVRPINDTMRIRQRDALVAYILQQRGSPYANSLVCTTSANAISGATQVTLTNAAGVAIGQTVQGVNIAPGTTVTAISGTTVTVSSALLGPLPSGSNLVFIPAVPLIDTADKLFEYFLIDVENQPPTETSRIRLALSSVQLFIERILRNLEPQVSPNDIDASLWPWMKRYRVWQANREVFLWPENWLYPELRDDQSPFFQETMSALLQSDITDDAAANAYLDYLTKLEEVAKLEPCGLYYVPQSGDSNEISYVVARTAGAHRKYYFRKLENASWTPWTEVKIDCEDMPITPIVWNGRLFLFWLKILKQSSLPSGTLPPPADPNASSKSLTDTNTKIGDLASAGPSTGQAAAIITVQAVLCWSEFYNGKWQPTKTSDVNQPTSFGPFEATGDRSIDTERRFLRIYPAVIAPDPIFPLPPDVSFDIPPDALLLTTQDEKALVASVGGGGFVLYNTHSLPVRFDDFVVKSRSQGTTSYLSLSTIPPNTQDPSRTMHIDETANSVFWISYWRGSDGGFGNELIVFKRAPRFVEPQSNLSSIWYAPFFYEDRRNLFYVTTNAITEPNSNVSGFGISPDLQATKVRIPPLVFPQSSNSAHGGFSWSASTRVGIGAVNQVSYQGRDISLRGSARDIIQANPGRLTARVRQSW